MLKKQTAMARAETVEFDVSKTIDGRCVIPDGDTFTLENATSKPSWRMVSGQIMAVTLSGTGACIVKSWEANGKPGTVILGTVRAGESMVLPIVRHVYGPAVHFEPEGQATGTVTVTVISPPPIPG